ncbi:alpha/beta hydrolase, partial [Metarhizium majus ARSEF 297]
MYSFLQSSFLDFELTRLLGSTSSGGCDVAEFLEAVSKIKKNDPESWFSAWHEQSRRAERIAREAAQHGHASAAQRGFLRSSNYARASGYMFMAGDERVLETAERAVSLFREAFAHMDGQVIVLDMPYRDDISMPGYLYLPPESRRMPGSKTPVVVHCCGADSTQEELYFALVCAGAELGYAVVTFEGPGQGMLLKRDKVSARGDYEVVTGKVLDCLQHISEQRPEWGLDLERIGVAGASMGAYYSLRACVDPRIKACVAIDGFYSLWAVAMERMPGWYSSLWLSGWLPEWLFDALVRFGMKMDFTTRWEFGLGMAMMGTATPGNTLRRFREFSLDREGDEPIVDRIKCPVLLTGASRSLYASAQDGTVAVYSALKRVPENEKEVWIPSSIGDGGMTGKVGAWALLAQKSFQFFDKHLRVHRDGAVSGGISQGHA